MGENMKTSKSRVGQDHSPSFRSEQLPARNKRYFTIPQEGESAGEVLSELHVAASRSPNSYSSGEAFAKPGTIVDPVALAAMNLMTQIMNGNLVDNHMFEGAYEIEREALSMTSRLLGKNENEQPEAGFFLSGGSESIYQATWLYRNKYFNERDICVDKLGVAQAYGEMQRRNPNWKPPVILCPVDAHFAVTQKSPAILGMGQQSVALYGLNERFETDMDDLESVINEIYEDGRDIMLHFGVAGDTQKGRIENISEVRKLIEDASAFYGRLPPATCVDAAAQYLFAPLMKRSPSYSEDMPDWDFSVKGVDAIVCDPHKNQMPYPAGALLLRNSEIIRNTNMQTHYLSLNMHGVAPTPLSQEEIELAQACATIPTSRSASGAAATWAYYVAYGIDKLRAKKEMIWEVVQQIAQDIRDSDKYELICAPQTSVVAFKLKKGSSMDLDRIYKKINEGPDDRLYISGSSALLARTKEDLMKAEGKSMADSPFTGLYVHVMEHNTTETAKKLITRLHEVL